jgi:hypothetical protein
MLIRGLLTLMFGFAAAPTTSFSQAAVNIAPDSIISVASFDWNGDGTSDRAILTEGAAGNTDLYIYLSAPAQNNNQQRELALVKQDAAWWGGGGPGSQPSLEVNPKGSLLLMSGNWGIGRDRWEQTLTIAYRNDQFIVAGITLEVRDTLDHSAGGNCDLNLLTGRGTRNGRGVDIGAQTILLSTWKDERRVELCQLER